MSIRCHLVSNFRQKYDLTSLKCPNPPFLESIYHLSIKSLRYVILLCLVLSIFSCKNESKKIREMEINGVDLSRIEDGEYVGSFTHYDFIYKLQVEVKDQRIANIRVLSFKNGKHRDKALAVIPRVLEKQSLGVDVVTGATKTSKILLKAMESALASGTE